MLRGLWYFASINSSGLNFVLSFILFSLIFHKLRQLPFSNCSVRRDTAATDAIAMPWSRVWYSIQGTVTTTAILCLSDRLAVFFGRSSVGDIERVMFVVIVAVPLCMIPSQVSDPPLSDCVLAPSRFTLHPVSGSSMWCRPPIPPTQQDRLNREVRVFAVNIGV